MEGKKILQSLWDALRLPLSERRGTQKPTFSTQGQGECAQGCLFLSFNNASLTLLQWDHMLNYEGPLYCLLTRENCSEAQISSYYLC